MTSFFSKMERHPIGISGFKLTQMKMCLSNGLVGEVLKTLVSALGLPLPWTSLCVTFFVGVCYRQSLCSTTSLILYTCFQRTLPCIFTFWAPFSVCCVSLALPTKIPICNHCISRQAHYPHATVSLPEL